MSQPNPNPSSRRKKIFLILLTLYFGVMTLHLLNERSAEKDWNAYKQAAAARGEPIEWNLHIPVPPSDSQNFYGVPIARKWMPIKGPGSHSVVKEVKAASGGPVNLVELKPSAESRAGSPRHPAGFKLGPPARIADLKTLPRGQREGEMTLEALHTWNEQWNAEFEEFRAAGARPYVYLEGDYSFSPAIPIQNFVAARTLAQFLATKTGVNLLLGNSEMAGKDLESIEAVMRGMETKPTTLVAAMIRTAIAGLYYDVIKSGLAEGLWKPAEIKRIQQSTASFDILGNVQDAILNGERIGIIQVLETATTLQGGAEVAKIIGTDERSRIKELIGALYPRGWIRNNQIYIAGILDETAAVMDAKTRKYYPERGKAISARVAQETQGFRPNRVFAAIAIPNFTKAFETAARNQSLIDMTTVVCALELHKAAKGAYPAQLSELTPGYLSAIPRDIVSGQPITYKRPEPAKFMLYAVGADGKDNGGDSKTDWVWGM